MNRRYLITMLAASTAAACAPRGAFVRVPPRANSTDQPVFVVTDRNVTDDLRPTGGRAQRVSYGRINVSIPQSHKTGAVEYPLEGEDNTNRFGVSSVKHLSSDTALLSGLAQSGPAHEDVTIFIHGYNNSLAEAVYRHAQIAHDFEMKGPQITFSWTSAAQPLGYAYDQSSIAIARDRLEQLLILLANRQSRRIVIVAHSLGSMLAVEVLRQMVIGGRRALFNRFSAVILMSPDISVEVFRAQVARIGTLPKPFVVFVSQTDKALEITARVTGQSARLGSTSDIALMLGMGIVVIDLSSITDGASGNHISAVSSPTAIAVLNGLRQSDGLAKMREKAPNLLQKILYEPI